MMRVTRFFPTVLVAALVVGCGGGQTGDLSGENDKKGRTTGGENNCQDQVDEISLDEVSALGFDANAVLAFSSRRFETNIAWQALNQVEYSPSAGQSSVALTLSSGNKAWFVHSEPTPSEGQEGPTIGLALVCPPDRLRVAVHADLNSADGALAESFDGVLEARSRYVATLSQTIGTDQVSGSFEIAQVTPPQTGTGATASLKDLKFDAVLTPGGMAGTLSGQLTSSDGQSASASTLTFARFPSDTRCAANPGVGGATVPVSADNAALGQTGAQAVNDVNAQGPLALIWDDGSESALTLELSKLGDGCVKVASGNGFDGPTLPAASVVYPVTLKATTADGRWKGEYAASLQTWPNDYDLGFSERIAVNGTFVVGMPDATGFSQVSIPSGTQRLGVIVEAQFETQNVKGHVSLSALKDPACVTNPEPPSGNSVPGCSGTEVTTLVGAVWPR